MTTTLSDPLTERVSHIARECLLLGRDLTPDAVTDERMEQLLAAMDQCVRDAENGATIDLIPDLSLLDNHRIFWRRAIIRILEEAPWLASRTKTALACALASTPRVMLRSKYELTFDCFSSRIPQFTRDLAPLFAGRPDLSFLEIGSFEGHSACWLLDNILTHETSRLVCVDLFRQKTSEALFDANIQRSGAAARVTKLTGPSQEILPTLDAGRFDFIYVDGGHEQDTVLQDCVYAWRLLAPGGLMTLDDYGMSREPLVTLLLSEEHHPEQAIDAFLTAFANRCDVLYKGYHVTIRKRPS